MIFVCEPVHKFLRKNWIQFIVSIIPSFSDHIQILSKATRDIMSLLRHYSRPKLSPSLGVPPIHLGSVYVFSTIDLRFPYSLRWGISLIEDPSVSYYDKVLFFCNAIYNSLTKYFSSRYIKRKSLLSPSSNSSLSSCLVKQIPPYVVDFSLCSRKWTKLNSSWIWRA